MGTDSEFEVRAALRQWLFDLHRSGRVIGSQIHREVEQIAVLVVAAGGSLHEAFSAARSILPDPKTLGSAA
ncbi:MAG: hypothetical protein ACLGIB_03430 [Actinomycetota bacterium]